MKAGRLSRRPDPVPSMELRPANSPGRKEKSKGRGEKKCSPFGVRYPQEVVNSSKTMQVHRKTWGMKHPCTDERIYNGEEIRELDWASGKFGEGRSHLRGGKGGIGDRAGSQVLAPRPKYRTKGLFTPPDKDD